MAYSGYGVRNPCSVRLFTSIICFSVLYPLDLAGVSFEGFGIGRLKGTPDVGTNVQEIYEVMADLTLPFANYPSINLIFNRHFLIIIIA